MSFLLSGLGLLLWAASMQVAPALDPVSLWLDDLWVATLVKHASLSQLVWLHAPTPYGFVALLKLIRGVFGDGHLQLQAAPVCARLAAIAGLGVVTYELTRHAGLGLLAAVGMALQYEIAEQAVRIKPYAMDACISVALLGLGVYCLRRPSSVRLLAFGAFWLLALPCSFPSAFVGPPLFSLCALFHALDTRHAQPRRALRALTIAAVVDALGAALLFWMVQQKTTPALQEFWPQYYPATDRLRHFKAFFVSGPGRDFLSAAFEPARYLALLMPVGLVLLLRTRWTRPLACFAILLLVAVVASASLRLYPLGSPRLDSFVRPIEICLAVVALRPLTRGRPFRLAAHALCGVLLLWAANRVRHQVVAYVPAGEKPLAAMVQRWLEDADTGLLLFPWANWAFAYYTNVPVQLVPVQDSTNGYFALPQRPNSLVLRERWNGVFFSDYAHDKRAFNEQIAPLMAAGLRRIAFYGSYGDPADYRAMLRHLRKQHYEIVKQKARHKAIAVLLERR